MSPAPRHRHAIDGGYQRGEETRARIVDAALALFGEYGFDRKRVGHQPFIDPINDGDGVPARQP